MNKYIKTDIETGYKYLKVGIMNILNEIKSGEITRYDFIHDIPISLLLECIIELKWIVKNYDSLGYTISIPNSEISIFAGLRTIYKI